MKITFNQWGGSAPRLDPRAVPVGMAVTAKNTRPDPYSLKPWIKPQVTNARVRSSAKTLYRYTDRHWFEWDWDVSVVKAPIINDPNQEVIFTDRDGVKFTRNTFALSSAPYPNNSRMIGVPQPEKPRFKNNAPTNDVAGVDTIDIAYVVTFVNEFGREGPASKVSDITMSKNKRSTSPSPVRRYRPVRMRLAAVRSGVSTVQIPRPMAAASTSMWTRCRSRRKVTPTRVRKMSCLRCSLLLTGFRLRTPIRRCGRPAR